MGTKFKEGYRGYTIWNWQDDNRHHVSVEVHNKENKFLRNEDIFIGQSYAEAIHFINKEYGDNTDKYIYIPRTPKKIKIVDSLM